MSATGNGHGAVHRAVGGAGAGTIGGNLTVCGVHYVCGAVAGVCGAVYGVVYVHGAKGC
jgi:hypothetical protein